MAHQYHREPPLPPARWSASLGLIVGCVIFVLVATAVGVVTLIPGYVPAALVAVVGLILMTGNPRIDAGNKRAARTFLAVLLAIDLLLCFAV